MKYTKIIETQTKINLPVAGRLTAVVNGSDKFFTSRFFIIKQLVVFNSTIVDHCKTMVNC